MVDNFPGDLCISTPHVVVCEYFSDTTSLSATSVTPHITELSLGYVSDYSTNPPCNSNSTLDPFLFSPVTHLRKQFFYECFTEMKIPFPDFSPLSSRNSTIEELIFIENPALYGSISDHLSDLSSLKRFILTGSNVFDEIPGCLTELVNVEQLSLSSNKFEGDIPTNFFRKVEDNEDFRFKCKWVSR